MWGREIISVGKLDVVSIKHNFLFASSLSLFSISCISFFNEYSFRLFSISDNSSFPRTQHGNVGHMTWGWVRNIPAQLCYPPGISQLLGALVSMHPLSQYTRFS